MFDSIKNFMDQRKKCSQCNQFGIQVDRRIWQCPKHGAWDATSEPEQRKVLIREANTVIDDML